MKKLLHVFFLALVSISITAFFVSCSEDDFSVSIPENQELQFNQETVISSQAQSITFMFTTGTSWSVQSISSNDDWCQISALSGQKGNHSLVIITTANESTDDRTCTFNFSFGKESRYVKITQKAKDALTLTSSRFEIPREGGNIDIVVKTNIDYTFEIEGNSKSWIHQIESRGSVADHHNSFIIDANDDYTSREGTIKVKSTVGEEIVHISQDGGAKLILSQTTIPINAKGGEVIINVSSNYDYGVEILDNVNWLHSSPSSRSMRTTDVILNADENSTPLERDARVAIFDLNSEKADTIIIVQECPECIDLGLPSGTLWATRNLGAEKSFMGGGTYAWSYNDYYKKEQGIDSEGFATTNEGYTKYVRKNDANQYGFNGFYDNKTSLEPEDDRATFLLGHNWRTPTKADFEELVANCKFERKDSPYIDKHIYLNYFNGVPEESVVSDEYYLYKVIGPNGKYIYLCYKSKVNYGNYEYQYWTANLSDKSDAAYYFTVNGQFLFTSNSVGFSSNYRSRDNAIRPIYDPK